MPTISVADLRRTRRASLGSLIAGVGLLLLAAGVPRRIPSTFRFEVGARPELHRLWEASAQAKEERVACLAAAIHSDTIDISRVLPLASRPADSLGISAGASLDQCGPPEWHGTVHTHVALRDGQRPYSLFSGADRGVMMIWWRRWQVDGVFCLLYSSEEAICEIEGPQGAVLFPRSRY